MQFRSSAQKAQRPIERSQRSARKQSALLRQAAHEPLASQYGAVTGHAAPSRQRGMQTRASGWQVAFGPQSAGVRHSTQRWTVVSQRRYGATTQSTVAMHSTH